MWNFKVMGVIYQILNILDGKIYIGSAVDFNKRYYHHLYKLNNNSHKNKHLQAAWNLYGEENFIFMILENVDNNKNLIKEEQAWIDVSDCCNNKKGYNINLKANSPLGRRVSEETKRKISLANKGRKNSPEHIAKVALKAIGNRSKTGQKPSIETRIKLSISRIGNQNNRKHDKWPHELGCKCRCNECKRRWMNYYYKKDIKYA